MFKKIYIIIITLSLIPSRGMAYAIDTAIGNIPTNPAGFTNKILSISIGLAGGLSFLLMIYACFLFITSSGDQQKLQEATEIITSAIAGLLMIIFSVFLLDFIGAKILLIF